MQSKDDTAMGGALVRVGLAGVYWVGTWAMVLLLVLFIGIGSLENNGWFDP